jgi:hypothetical protein
MVMVNFVAIRCDSARYDMDMVVICVMMTIDEQRLAGIIIAHFPKVVMGYSDELFLGTLITSA